MAIKTELPGGIKLKIDTVDEYIELMTKLKGAYNRTQVSVRKVGPLRRRHRRSTRGNGCSRWTEEDKRLLKELYMKGYRTNSIAKKLNRTEASISSQIIHRQFIKRPKGL